MTESIRWLLATELIGLAAFPLAYAAFPALTDRGWGLSKPIGLVVVGFVVWITSYAGILPNDAWAWWLALGVVGIVGWGLFWRRRAEVVASVRARWKFFLAGEALFLAFFVVWTLYRAYDPAIGGTEKPMDFMMMNASYRAESAPPEDAWLSGNPVAYYYFGYWMMAGVAKLAAVPTHIGFNLALSLIAAMSAGAVFSLAGSLVMRKSGSIKAAVVWGTASTLLLLVVASLAGWWELLANFGAGGKGFYEWLHIDGLSANPDPSNWRPDTHWWWWRASRVINTFAPGGGGQDYTIEEFPFFSFLLGDMHPHVMSIPFVIAGLAIAFNILTSPVRWGFGWIASNRAAALVTALLAGAAGFINAWDIAFLAALLFGAVVLKVRKDTGSDLVRAALRGLPALLLLIGTGVVLFSPFYFGTFQSQVRWPPVAPVEFGTRPIHFLTVWGLPLLIAAPALAGFGMPAVRAHFDWLRSAVRGAATDVKPPMHPVWLGAAMVVLPYLVWGITHLEYNDLARAEDTLTRLASTLPLMVVVVGLLTAVAVRAKAGKNNETQFVLLIALVAFYLLFWAEFFFVHDFFGNRMNTVFKFYYQAWIIFAVVGGFALWWWWQAHAGFRGWRLITSRTAAVVACVLVVGCLYYPAAAVVSKTNSFRGSPTLDGLAYMKDSVPVERGLIDALSADASRDNSIVEAPGGSYTEFARISGSTGLPTVIGWTGHEHQWHGTLEPYDDREPDIERLYTTADASEAQQILNKYGVDYVVIGPRERQKYPALITSKFDGLGTLFFSEGPYVAYKMNEDAPGG